MYVRMYIHKFSGALWVLTNFININVVVWTRVKRQRPAAIILRMIEYVADSNAIFIFAPFNNSRPFGTYSTYTFGRVLDSLDIQGYLITGMLVVAAIISGFLGYLMGINIRGLHKGGETSLKNEELQDPLVCGKHSWSYTIWATTETVLMARANMGNSLFVSGTCIRDRRLTTTITFYNETT